jgi:hypothetical protein
MILASCSYSSFRNLVYFSNLEDRAEYEEKVVNTPASKIQPKFQHLAKAWPKFLKIPEARLLVNGSSKLYNN